MELEPWGLTQTLYNLSEDKLPDLNPFLCILSTNRKQSKVLHLEVGPADLPTFPRGF